MRAALLQVWVPIGLLRRFRRSRNGLYTFPSVAAISLGNFRFILFDASLLFIIFRHRSMRLNPSVHRLVLLLCLPLVVRVAHRPIGSTRTQSLSDALSPTLVHGPFSWPNMPCPPDSFISPSEVSHLTGPHALFPSQRCVQQGRLF